MTSSPRITGNAQIGSLSVPAISASWTVVDKTSVAEFLGGRAIIRRRDDTGKFHGYFEIPLPDPVSEEGEYVDEAMAGKHSYKVNQPLHDCGSLALAQLEMEKRIREHMTKSHPELLELKKVEEVAATIEAAGEDPF